MRKTLAVSFVAAAALTLAAVASAADPSLSCRAAKMKAAGKYNACRLSAEAKSILSGDPPDYAKCSEKFTGLFDKAEEKAGAGACVTEDDAPQIGADVAGDATAIACKLRDGTPVGGYCWYLGAGGDDCESTCVNRGLAYDNATNTFAGYNGSLSNCAAVVAAAPKPPPAACTTDYNSNPANNAYGFGLGCYWVGPQNTCPFHYYSERDTGAVTTSTGSVQLFWRLCACS